MKYLRNNQAQDILIGPIVDYANGVEPVTTITTMSGFDSAIVIDADYDDIDISGRTITHVSDGWYTIGLLGTDCDEYGDCIIALRDDDLFVPLWEEACVVTDAFYYAQYSASPSTRLHVDVYGQDGTLIEDAVETALDTAIPTTPTAGSVNDHVDRARKCSTNKIIINEGASPPTLTIYDDDGSTPLYVFNLYDASSVGAHQNVYEKVPQ